MISVIDIAWAAGFLEGEGSFGCYGIRTRKTPNIRVAASQVQAEPLERLKHLFGGSIHHLRAHKEGQSDYFQWAISSSRAMGVMMTLFRLMSPRRQTQIRAALTMWMDYPSRPRQNRATCRSGHHLWTAENIIGFGTNKRTCRPCTRERERHYGRQAAS